MAKCEVVAREIADATSVKTKCLCELCNISFCSRGNLYKHLRKFHQLQIVRNKHQTCVLCDEKFYSISQLHEHLQKQHPGTLKFVNETFYSKKDFLDWKYETENKSLSSFILRKTNVNRVSDINTAYYHCHRSGHSKMKQNRIRRMKASGSIKTGNTCPAFIKAATQTIDGISEIKVQYQSVHLGHDLEVRTLNLTKQGRENLAACLKLGIPMDKILEEARRNTSPTNPYSHLTRKHLHNIRRKFKIPINDDKPPLKKVDIPQNADVEASDSSIGYEDYIEIESSNSVDIQDEEKNTAVSSLLMLQNQNFSDEFNNRKKQIVDQLKELQTRIEEWDPGCPLPDVEEHIRAINARLDISAPSNRALHSQEMLPVVTPAPTNNPKTKRRRITKTKGSKKNQLN